MLLALKKSVRLFGCLLSDDRKFASAFSRLGSQKARALHINSKNHSPRAVESGCSLGYNRFSLCMSRICSSSVERRSAIWASRSNMGRSKSVRVSVSARIMVGSCSSISTTSVSYTHLDVYKRQSQTQACLDMVGYILTNSLHFPRKRKVTSKQHFLF